MSNLYRISQELDGITRHVIFFHGLGGDAYGTWQSSHDIKTCWLYWLDEDIDELSVWTVAYEASISRWRGSAMHLADRAVNVLERILIEPQLQTGEIVLVGHSLGGLVIKQLLRAAESMSHQRTDVDKFIKRVRRVAFLATPHSGSGLATLGDKLRIIFLPSAATACLIRNDPFLRELTYWYREWSVSHGIHHLILMENKPIRIAGFVVKPDSSDPGLLTRPISIDADHFGICKPRNSSSDIYLLVSDFLRRSLEVKACETTIERIINTQSNQLGELVDLTQEIKAQGEIMAENVSLALDTFSKASSFTKYPKELVDNEIEKSLSVIRRARFIVGFTPIEHSIRLADKIQNGEFGGGSDGVKSRALAWCARLLSIGENREKSDELITSARQLGSGPEITVAEAFRLSESGNIDDVLFKLASIESPLSNSAAFFIVSKHKDAASSIEWLAKSGISLNDLDSDGKFFLISKLFELGQWDKAFEHTNALQEDDYQNSPVLFHAAAIACLVQAIPDEFRVVDVRQMLFQARTLPLASDEAALNNRIRAQALFSKCALAAREFDCVESANIAEDFALWLELRDPDAHGTGLQKLQESMRDSAHSLRRLHLALQFGVKVDLVSVEKEIDRQTAISGGKSQIAAMARFALTFAQKCPKDVASYIDRYRTQLQEYLEKKSLNIIEIEMLAQAGSTQRAEELLKGIADDGLSEPEQNRLRRIIAESAGADPIEARKALFETSGQIYDLINLVNLLEEQNDQIQLCRYSLLLFEKTKALRDAERLALTLNNTNQYTELMVFLKKYPVFLDQSDNLQMLWCWALYREGLLAEAATELGKLRAKRDHENDRALTINLAIAQGDWDSLQTYVEYEWVHREEREADDLMRTAKLAQVIVSQRAKELLYAAAAKGSHSAHILAAAYFLASSAGWEDDAVVSGWLQRAATLSDDCGPLKKMSIKDIADQAPEWNRRQTDIWSQLHAGSIPVFGAAHLLNRSLVDIFLLPALANRTEQDPRRRALVPAFSGVRQPVPCNYRVVAMEATTLLTLGYLGLLETAFSMFEQVLIPHSTLAWLFGEKQKVSFHQPSRIKNASMIRHLLAVSALKEFKGNSKVDIDLAAEIGEELASLIAEAQSSGSGDETQRLVIRSSPVHRVGSLLDEEADLSAYYPYLCSCIAVVNKLKQKGQLTATEESRARSYLALHEKNWPCQPDISDSAILYLDDLSVTYLQQAGVLDKIGSAGLVAYVSTQQTQEVNTLLSYNQLSSEVLRVIELIRSKLAEGINTGKVKVGHMPESYRDDESSLIDNHPTFAIYHLAKDAEAVIADDRFLNQHMNVEVESVLTPVLTTLDLLDALHMMGRLSFEQFAEHRTSLRRGGYIFVTTTQNELNHYLASSTVKEGKLSETAELKAVRENLLSIRMSRFLQLPKEANWIASTMQAFTLTLKAQWRSEIDEATSRARSEWLLKQIDLRGWAHCFHGEAGLNILSHGYGTQIMSLLFAPSDVSQDVEEKYLVWIEENLLAHLKEDDPEIYEFLINRTQELITDSVDSAFAEESLNGI